MGHRAGCDWVTNSSNRRSERTVLRCLLCSVSGLTLLLYNISGHLLMSPKGASPAIKASEVILLTKGRQYGYFVNSLWFLELKYRSLTR